MNAIKRITSGKKFDSNNVNDRFIIEEAARDFHCFKFRKLIDEFGNLSKLSEDKIKEFNEKGSIILNTIRNWDKTISDAKNEFLNEFKNE